MSNEQKVGWWGCVCGLNVLFIDGNAKLLKPTKNRDSLRIHGVNEQPSWLNKPRPEKKYVIHDT